MLHVGAHPRFDFSEHLKMHKNAKKKSHFTLKLMIHLIVQSRDTFDGALKDALRMMGACEVALKSALQVALELQLWLNLFMQCIMHKWHTYIWG